MVELPLVFATASAENFALGGVKLAQKIGAETLLFGSECGDITMLRLTAEMLSSPSVNQRIKEEISKGVSYPKAVANALGIDILDSPNNVLALEYLKAIDKIGAHIEPVTIKRQNNYNSAHPKGRYASSTAIRETPSIADKFSFPYVAQDIDVKTEEEFKQFAVHMLSLMTAEQIGQIEGMTEGIENRIFAADKSNGYEAMLEEIKTKRYTRAKLQRLVLSSVLGVTKQYAAQTLHGNIPTNILAVSQRATKLLALEDKYYDVVCQRADRLYYSFSTQKPPIKMQVVEQPKK